MKKKFTILIAAAVMLLTMVATTGEMWGQSKTEESLVCLTFPDDNSGNNGLTSNQYTSTWTATSGSYSWSISNFNNNNWNNNWNYIKCGRKNNASVATIITSAAISESIIKVEITIDAITASKINSIKLYTSSNGSSWTEAGTYTKETGTKSVSLTSPTANLYYKVEFDCASGSANGLVTVSKVEFYHNTGGNPTVTTPEITPNGGSFLDSQEVSISCATTGATIYYTTDGSTPSTTSTQYTTPFTIDETTTVKAYAVLTNYDDSQVATATFTKATALTVAEAIAATPATGTSDYVYISGIVSAFYNTSIIGDGSNYRYYISDDGTTTNQLLVYKGNGLNNVPFANVNDLLVNDHVIIYGKLTTYNNTKEVAAGNYIYSLERPTVTVEAPTFSPTAGTYDEAQSVTLSCATDGATIYYTTDGTNPTNESTQYASAINIASTTTIKAIAYVGEDYSTVTTATYTIVSINNISDITEVGTAYSVKGTVVAINSRGFVMGDGTGYVYYYKGEDTGKSVGNKIKVTGTTGTYGQIIQFTNTATVSEATSSSYNNTPAATVITAVPDYSTGYHLSTYLEFTGTLEKSSSNYFITVGEGQIQISYPTSAQSTALTALDGKTVHVKGYFSGINSSSKFTVMLESAEEVVIPSITVNPTSVEAPADETQGTITVTLTAIADNEIEVQWFESDGTTTATYNHDWVLTDVNTDKNIDYVIGANTGVARTAYFKVYGMDGEANDVYSDLVTISQAAYVAPTPSIAVTPTLVEATADETQGTITVTLTAIANNEIEVQWFESDGTTAATYNHDWVLTDVNTDKNIDYVIGANTGAARTAYFKVYGMDGEANDVYSELVTISQAAYVPPVQTENYELFSGNLVEGDYLIVYDDGAMNTTLDNSNRLQFVEVEPNNDVISTNNAEIVWHIAPSGEYWTIYNADADKYAAGTGAKNKIQLLDDATTDNALWTVTGTTTYEFVNKANSDASVNANLRRNGDYGFACYSTSTGGALSLYKKIDNTPSITINPGPYNLNADGGNAVLPVTTSNLATDPQLAVAFYESDGVTPATYDWISAEINGDGNVAGHIDANTGEARSAYFKVSGLANDNTTTVYSDLVTVNQAAYALSIVFETTELNIEVGGEQDRIISFEYQGLGENPTFEVRQYDATGETQTTYDWFTTTITQEHKVNITVAANTGAARSGYFKVYGSNGTVNTESNLVTINQAEYVAPTYTVTYNANGGTGTMTDSNSPYVENAEVTLLENTFGAPEGKIWDSWLVKDADQNTISVNEGKFNMPASNVTVTAQWVDDPYAPTYEWVLTALEDLTSNDVFVIVGNNGNNYAMSNDKGTSNPPVASSVTVANNKLSNAPADNLKWNISVDTTGGYIFYPNGVTNKWLYCTDANNGLRVGTGNIKVFAYEEVTTTDKEGYYLTISPASDKRYVCIYNNADWRSYKSGSIVKTDTKFYKRQVASTDPTIFADDVNIESEATEGEITYTLENEVQGGVLSAEITAGNEGNWLELGTVGATVPFTCSANTEQTERTATVTLTYTYNTQETVTATAVVTQAALVIDFATMPFEYDGNGTGDLPTGLTPTGLGTYNASPKMKFDGTGDNLILKLNAAPVSLSYDIKGNGFSGGTFTVQTSANGTDYSDLATYTELGEVQSVTHVDLDADVRYIKWIYTNKKTGNVALGNIHATEHYDTYGDVTLNDLNLTTASESLIIHRGSVVTLTGTVTNDSPDNLVIEDGGQLIHDTPINATIQRNVKGYDANRDASPSGYMLIASPVYAPINVTSTNLTTGEYDLYIFAESQPEKEWRNYKAGEFTTIENEKGYLYANKSNGTISFAGTLRSSINNVTVNLDYTDGNRFAGWNLVGNPFACNVYANDTTGKGLAFYKMNENGDGFEAVTNGSVAPMEGIFVHTDAKGKSFVFTRSIPEQSQGKGNLNIQIAQVVNNRDAQPATDNAIIRFDNGNALEKFSFRDNTTKVYIPQGNKDYAVVSAEAQGEMPVNFKAEEDGTYTISFNTENVEFGYLHLIDNKTGNDIDLLQTSSYTFEASRIDYASRFRLVFSAIGNENDSENNDFGFFDANGNFLILGIEGTATLQVMDVTGRVISNETFSGDYSKAINASAGVYMLRLIQGSNVRTQKIVVR